MTLTSDLLRGLNEQQHAAVTLPAQHALILAGAGSGKTRVLTTRIAWLIASAQVSPQGLLAVTFTNKAAREMLNRLSAMVAVNLKLMWVGTFHGLCNRMLRAHHRDAGLPASFQILDSQDQLAAIKRMLKARSNLQRRRKMNARQVATVFPIGLHALRLLRIAGPQQRLVLSGHVNRQSASPGSGSDDCNPHRRLSFACTSRKVFSAAG